MSMKKDEALKLAEALAERLENNPTDREKIAAAAELLRLHALNTELLEVLKQIDKLPGISSANLYARAAIAKAEKTLL